MMAISAQQTKIHVAIATWEWGSYFDPKLKIDGIKLNISSWRRPAPNTIPWDTNCLLYTSDAADEEDSVDLGGRRSIKTHKCHSNRQ